MPSKKSTATAPPYAQPLVPGESVILPTKKLKRIFIGLGWNNANGATVDLDCSIVGYGADGTRDDQSTVYYGRLRNGKQRSSPMGSSIVHTGDILKGKEGNAVLEDMERIYVYLSEVPDHLATIAFAADVFTDQLSFSSLSNAYVRIVNADTNQELARLTLTSAYLGPIAQSRVVLLARLRRLAGVVATTAGVAAATAIFLMSSDLSSLMLSPELFTAGVDFSTLELPDVSGAGAFFEEGLAATGGALEGGIEMAGSGLEAAGEMAGSGLEAAGEMANEGAGFCGGLCGSLCSSGSVQQAEEMATGAAEQVSTMAGEGLAAATAMATGAAEQVSTLAGEGLTTVAALAGDGLATVTAVASTAGETVMKVVEGVSEVVGALGSSSD